MTKRLLILVLTAGFVAFGAISLAFADQVQTGRDSQERLHLVRLNTREQQATDLS